MFGPSIGGFLYQLGGFSLPFWVSGWCGVYIRRHILEIRRVLPDFSLFIHVQFPTFNLSLIFRECADLGEYVSFHLLGGQD